METTPQAQIEQVYTLLHEYGPATAYEYMERTGDLKRFPASLVRMVTAHLTGGRSTARRARSGSSDSGGMGG